MSQKREFVRQIFCQAQNKDIQDLKRGFVSVLVVRNIEFSRDSLTELLLKLGAFQEQDVANGAFINAIHGQAANKSIDWHADRAYHPYPPRFLALYSLSALDKKRGGGTCFCDLQKAYRDMPEEMKKKINPLNLLYFNRYMLYKACRPQRGQFRLLSAIHSLVQSDETGEYLFFNRDYADDFELKSELCRHIYKKAYIYTHYWSRFDLVISNNFKTNHLRQETLGEGPPYRNILRFHLR